MGAIWPKPVRLLSGKHQGKAEVRGRPVGSPVSVVETDNGEAGLFVTYRHAGATDATVLGLKRSRFVFARGNPASSVPRPDPELDGCIKERARTLFAHALRGRSLARASASFTALPSGSIRARFGREHIHSAVAAPGP